MNADLEKILFAALSAFFVLLIWRVQVHWGKRTRKSELVDRLKVIRRACRAQLSEGAADSAGAGLNQLPDLIEFFNGIIPDLKPEQRKSILEYSSKITEIVTIVELLQETDGKVKTLQGRPTALAYQSVPGRARFNATKREYEKAREKTCDGDISARKDLDQAFKLYYDAARECGQGSFVEAHRDIEGLGIAQKTFSEKIYRDLLIRTDAMLADFG